MKQSTLLFLNNVDNFSHHKCDSLIQVMAARHSTNRQVLNKFSTTGSFASVYLACNTLAISVLDISGGMTAK